MLWCNRRVYNCSRCDFRTKAELYSCNISPLIALTSLSLPASRQRWIPTEERGQHQNALGLESGILRDCLTKNKTRLSYNSELVGNKIQFSRIVIHILMNIGIRPRLIFREQYMVNNTKRELTRAQRVLYLHSGGFNIPFNGL